MKLKYLLWIFLILVCGGLIFYIYSIAQDRYEDTKPLSDDISTPIEDITSETPTAHEETSDKLLPFQEDSDIEEDDYDAENNADLAESYPTILQEDCDNECSDYTESNKAYCEEVCGLTMIQKPKNDEQPCSDLTGIQQDICLKDLAILQRDFNICEEIQDASLKNTCKNRITEEILENGDNNQPL